MRRYASPTARAPPTCPSVIARQNPCASCAIATWPATRFGNVLSEKSSGLIDFMQ